MKARHTHLSDWLARSGQETPRQAAGALWTGRELERRPQVRDATTSGRITIQQAKAIGDALNALPTGLDAAQRRRAEDLILAEADHTPAEKLRTMTGTILRQVAPEAENAEQRAERLAARDARAYQRRSLRFGPEVDGSIEFSGNLPIADGRRLQRMVQTVADRAYRAAKDNADRQSLLQTPQQRLADALVTVVRAAEAVERGESVPVSIPAGAAQISVLMSATDLLDRANARGLLADGTELSPGELRRLACSADLVPVVLGTGSTILDLGRTHRLAPWHLRHAGASGWRVRVPGVHRAHLALRRSSHRAVARGRPDGSWKPRPAVQGPPHADRTGSAGQRPRRESRTRGSVDCTDRWQRSARVHAARCARSDEVTHPAHRSPRRAAVRDRCSRSVTT